MQFTEAIARAKGNLQFDAEYGYIRCMNHIINLAVKKGVEYFDAAITQVSYCESNNEFIRQILFICIYALPYTYFNSTALVPRTSYCDSFLTST